MKTARILILIGGAINALFFLFHLWFGWHLHRLTQVAPALRVTMEMLNGGGALMILFFAAVSLAFGEELLVTRVGRAVLILATAMYGLRAVGEVFLAPTFKPGIFIACALTGALYGAALALASHATVQVRPESADVETGGRHGMRRSALLP